jgi:hypothetical protein
MPLPLISPVSVTVERLDEASTEYHARAREPVKGVARNSTSVTFDAQHSQSMRRSRNAGDRAGEVKHTSGYLCTRQWILDAQSYTTPQNGDKITSIGGKAVTVYVTGLSDAGHLSGANTLVIINYSSQAPRRS